MWEMELSNKRATLAADRNRLEGGSYLSAVLPILWPGQAQVARTSRWHRRNGGTVHLVLPSADKPKLLVPARPRRVAASAVRNFKTAASTREQLVIKALAAATLVGLAGLVSDRIVIEYPDGVTPDGIDAHLSSVLGHHVWVSMYISPARAVRKPLLQVIGSDGETLAFAKVGVDPFTRALVRHEGKVVRYLATQPTSVLRVPSVLHSGTWRGHELLVQSAVDRGAAPQSDNPHLCEAMREVSRARGRTTATLTSSSYWQQTVRRVAALPNGEHKAALQRLVRIIEAADPVTGLEFGSSHGDWAPWNLTVAGGHVHAWDWEKFESDVPVGFDAVHFDVHGNVVLGGRTPAAAFDDALCRAQDLLAPFGVQPTMRPAVVVLYALHIAIRYLEDGELSAGAGRMSRLSSWLDSFVTAAADRVPRGGLAGDNG
jgi:hypothetical protein